MVDASVWTDHLRTGEPALVEALERANVLVHPLVLGELACGHLKNRREVLRLPGVLGDLPAAPTVMDRGIGYTDVHLLGSAALVTGARLWTRDQRLAAVASELGLAPDPEVQ